MIKLKEAVIVEGKYDKIKLSSLIDGTIITTDGFGIFKDKQKKELIKTLASTNGIIILTDSDSAGFLIRSHIKGFVKDGKITNVYIPDIFGKEKRKTSPSKEGKLGVEGIDITVLKNALERAGIREKENIGGKPSEKKVTKADLFEDGLSGCGNSKQMRQLFLKRLGLPERMSTNDLLKVINSIYSYDRYKEEIALILPTEKAK